MRSSTRTTKDSPAATLCVCVSNPLVFVTKPLHLVPDALQTPPSAIQNGTNRAHAHTDTVNWLLMSLSDRFNHLIARGLLSFENPPVR